MKKKYFYFYFIFIFETSCTFHQVVEERACRPLHRLEQAEAPPALRGGAAAPKAPARSPSPAFPRPSVVPPADPVPGSLCSMSSPSGLGQVITLSMSWLVTPSGEFISSQKGRNIILGWFKLVQSARGGKKCGLQTQKNNVIWGSLEKKHFLASWAFWPPKRTVRQDI